MIGTINPYWQNIVDGFYIGGNATKYTTAQKLGIVDSGWTTLSGPKTQIEFILSYITQGMTYTKSSTSGSYFFSCSKYLASLPSIFVRLGGYWIEIQGKDYGIVNSGDTCTFLIGINEDFWALGMTAMRGYYVTFDIANDRVGFAPQNDSTKAAIVNDPATSSTETPLTLPSTTTTTDTKPTSSLPQWAIITISVCAGVIAVVVAVLVALELIPEDSADTYDDNYYGDLRSQKRTRDFIRCSLLNDCQESKETAIQTLAASIGDEINSYAVNLLLDAYDSLIELATSTAMLQ